MPQSVKPQAPSGNDDGEIYGKDSIPHLQDVDDAAFRITQRYPGRIPALAQRMGVPASTLQKKVSPSCETHNLSVADAVHLQLVANQFDVLHAMAGACAHIALPMSDSTPHEVALRLAAIGAEVGDVFRVAQKALQDGVITPNERKEIAIGAPGPSWRVPDPFLTRTYPIDRGGGSKGWAGGCPDRPVRSAFMAAVLAGGGG